MWTNRLKALGTCGRVVDRISVWGSIRDLLHASWGGFSVLCWHVWLNRLEGSFLIFTGGLFWLGTVGQIVPGWYKLWDGRGSLLHLKLWIRRTGRFSSPPLSYSCCNYFLLNLCSLLLPHQNILVLFTLFFPPPHHGILTCWNFLPVWVECVNTVDLFRLDWYIFWVLCPFICCLLWVSYKWRPLTMCSADWPFLLELQCSSARVSKAGV